MRRDRAPGCALGAVARQTEDSRVGVAGFEPTTSSSRTKRATKLRHTPRKPGQPTERAAGWKPAVIGAGQRRGAGEQRCLGGQAKRIGAVGEVPDPRRDVQPTRHRGGADPWPEMSGRSQLVTSAP